MVHIEFYIAVFYLCEFLFLSMLGLDHFLGAGQHLSKAGSGLEVCLDSVTVCLIGADLFELAVFYLILY